VPEARAEDPAVAVGGWKWYGTHWFLHLPTHLFGGTLIFYSTCEILVEGLVGHKASPAVIGLGFAGPEYSGA
jgi:hypothetical protein